MSNKKIAVVTGASRGIGKAIALKLAADGAFVIVNYNGSKECAEAVVSEIKALGAEAVAYGCNISDYAASEAMFADIVDTYGGVDILINNAGITKDGLIMKMSEADYDYVLDINLKGVFNCIKHVSRQMIKKRSGRIINMTSVVGISGNAGQANYAASKAGIIGLTKSVAKEFGSRGITVNAVAPGFIDTEMTQVLSDNIKSAVVAQIPLGRFGSTDDIAELISFLVSEKAGYITGQVIQVDGGMVM